MTIDAATVLETYFNRRDRYGRYNAKGKAYTTAAGDPPLDVARVERHLNALGPQHIIGAHAISRSDDCLWAALDVDSHGPDAPTRHGDLLVVSSHMEKVGICPLVIKSGKAGHVLAVFEKPVRAPRLHLWGQHLLGRLKEAGLNDIEFFPKAGSHQSGVNDCAGAWLRLAGLHPKFGTWPAIYDWKTAQFREWDNGGAELFEDPTKSPDPYDLPEAPSVIGKSRKVRNSATGPEQLPAYVVDSNGEGVPRDDTLERLPGVVARIGAARADRYDGKKEPLLGPGWLEVGMAIHGTDPSANGLALWNKWSKQSKKWQPTVCRAKWDTFESVGDRRLGFGTLVKLAREDSGGALPSENGAPPMGRDQDETEWTPDIEWAKDIKLRPVKWLLYPLFASGAVNNLVGQGGSGKSTIAAWLAARISRGQEIIPRQLRPDPPIQGVTLICTSEDSFATTLAPRLKAAGADESKVARFTGFHRTNPESGEPESKRLTFADIRSLRSVIVEIDAVLVIFDPVQQFPPRGVDSHNQSETRDVLEPLGRMCEEVGCALLLIHHMGKDKKNKDAAYLGHGSTDFTDFVRCQGSIARYRKDEAIQVTDKGRTKFVLSPTKNNLTKEEDQLDIIYCMESWHGKNADGEEIEAPFFRHLESTKVDRAEVFEGAKPKGASMVEKVVAWLEEFLGEFPRPAVEVKEEATKRGFNGSLRRARGFLGRRITIISQTDSATGKKSSWWELDRPEDDNRPGAGHD